MLKRKLKTDQSAKTEQTYIFAELFMYKGGKLCFLKLKHKKYNNRVKKKKNNKSSVSPQSLHLHSLLRNLT